MLTLQGHVLTTRHGGSALPCPLVNFTAFDQVLAAAYGLPAGSSLTEIFGTPFSESRWSLKFCIVDGCVVLSGKAINFKVLYAKSNSHCGVQ